MSKFRFELNMAGVRELLKSNKMQKILDEHASNTLNRLGDGYEKENYVAETRAVSQVAATSSSARDENSENNTLLKAVHK